jgi:hypothetical protein
MFVFLGRLKGPGGSGDQANELGSLRAAPETEGTSSCHRSQKLQLQSLGYTVLSRYQGYRTEKTYN